MMRRAALIVIAALAAVAAPAQDLDNMAAGLPGPLTEVGFDQRLGEPLPLELEFTDAAGEPVVLGELFGERPVILAPVYYTCPMLCGMVLNGLVTSLKAVPFEAGSDYQVVAFSFDPSDTPEQAMARKENAVARYGGDGDGFHFLVGDAEAVGALSEAIGFRYAYDEASGEFAHAAGLVVATPEGVIARQFYGVEYPPRHVRLGLVEAAEGRIGGLVDQVLLYCFHYDPASGRYSAITLNLVRLGGALTVAALALLVLGMLYRERRLRLAAPAAAQPAPGAGGTR